MSRRHLRMSHWKIPSAEIVGGHVLVSYDDKKRKVYVDGTALTRVLSEKSIPLHRSFVVGRAPVRVGLCARFNAFKDSGKCDY